MVFRRTTYAPCHCVGALVTLQSELTPDPDPKMAPMTYREQLACALLYRVGLLSKQAFTWKHFD